MRVLIADDHEVVCAGLAQWLDRQHDMEVVAQARDGEEAVQLALVHRPDVVVMDLKMPRLSGIDATRAICEACPSTAVVIFTTFFDPTSVVAALDAGARGFYLKDSSPALLVDGLRAAADGSLALSPRVAGAMYLARTETDPWAALTPREREILGLIAAGRSNKQIARRLDITEKTVKAHCTRLFARLGVTDRTQAAVWAVSTRPEPARV